MTLVMYNGLKPILSAIDGATAAIGSSTLPPMFCRLASKKPRFGFVFGRLGITREACSTWFLAGQCRADSPDDLSKSCARFATAGTLVSNHWHCSTRASRPEGKACAHSI